MRPSITGVALTAGVMMLAACHKKPPPPPDQNIAIDNAIPANADIEELPPDESSGTSTNELARGDDNPDVNDLNASGNSD